MNAVPIEVVVEERYEQLAEAQQKSPHRYFQLVFVICLLPCTLHGQRHVQIHVIRAVDVQLNGCFRLAQEVLQSVIDKVLLVLLEIVNVHPDGVKDAVLGQSNWLLVEQLLELTVDGGYG